MYSALYLHVISAELTQLCRLRKNLTQSFYYGRLHQPFPKAFKLIFHTYLAISNSRRKQIENKTYCRNDALRCFRSKSVLNLYLKYQTNHRIFKKHAVPRGKFHYLQYSCGAVRYEKSQTELNLIEYPSKYFNIFVSSLSKGRECE